MKAEKIFYRASVITAIVSINIHCAAQSNKTPTVTWFIPGVSYQVSPTLRFQDQVAFDPDQHASFNYLQGFVTLNKHWILNAGYFYFHENNSGAKSYVENDGYLGASYIATIGPFVVDDRNMLNSTFPETGLQKNFYRNRIRATLPFSIGSSNIANLYVFDEGYYLFNRAQWTRNRIALGANYNLTKDLNLDFSYWKQDDYFSKKIDQLFIMLTLNLCSKKARH
ncbi:DUF2490 domain-containing protein [Mucilaginibacter sp.]|jgi:hypothetical protein|uniref:DUF2490 domain-containing protein n=1 Tax=Mucilaginibacter sp. TaxID=1882438 RepID=UPI003567171B